MTISVIIAQIIGLILIVLTILAPHFKTRKNILATALTANIMSCLMFLLVDARTGLFALIVTAIRSIVYWGYSTKGKKAPFIVFMIFMFLQIAATALGWVNIVSLLTLGLLFNTYGQWQIDESVLRICLIASAICIGVYCLYTGAYTGAINKFLQCGSTSFAIYRTRKRIDRANTK